MVTLEWKQAEMEHVRERGSNLRGSFLRCEVPGGWLVMWTAQGAGGLTFVPDPKHEWN